MCAAVASNAMLQFLRTLQGCVGYQNVRNLSNLKLLRQNETFIGGKWVKSNDGAQFEVKNPANGKVITSVPDCTDCETEDAITAAEQQFRNWGFNATAKERHDLLLKVHRLMIENQEELAKIMTTEQGKPLIESRGEIAYAASFLEWFAEEARRMNGDVLQSPIPGRQILHYREPVGVAAMITPWNFPSSMITRKAGAAIAAGCTCVVKPAEDTPLCALALAAVFEAAQAPPGLFNVVTCSRHNADKVGRTLCQSPRVQALSFTGSTDVGKLLLKQSADTVKKVSLELGGNAPFIVFNSADLEKAISGAMFSKFRNSGQTCVCANRIFVQSGVHDKFVKRLQEAMQNQLKLGDGLDAGVNQGPLINDKAVEKVHQMVTDAKGKGARVLLGGSRCELGSNFYQPTLLADCNPNMDLYRMEIFGPVAPIFKFETEDEVVALANNVRVGLAGYFYSQDMPQIFRIARRLEVGMVGANESSLSCAEAAFGGVKESGLGRESSRYGLDEFSNIKYVCLGGLSAKI